VVGTASRAGGLGTSPLATQLPGWRGWRRTWRCPRRRRHHQIAARAGGRLPRLGSPAPRAGLAYGVIHPAARPAPGPDHRPCDAGSTTPGSEITRRLRPAGQRGRFSVAFGVDDARGPERLRYRSGARGGRRATVAPVLGQSPPGAGALGSRWRCRCRRAEVIGATGRPVLRCEAIAESPERRVGRRE
jgi:hypothetical protein